MLVNVREFLRMLRECSCYLLIGANESGTSRDFRKACSSDCSVSSISNVFLTLLFCFLVHCTFILLGTEGWMKDNPRQKLRFGFAKPSSYWWWHDESKQRLTTVFVDLTRLWKTKHSRKHFQNFRQSCVLLRDRIEIHQSQPLAWPSDLLYVMLTGFDWWISNRYVDNTQDWRKFWKRFRGCFIFQSRVSARTVVTVVWWLPFWISLRSRGEIWSREMFGNPSASRCTIWCPENFRVLSTGLDPVIFRVQTLEQITLVLKIHDRLELKESS